MKGICVFWLLSLSLFAQTSTGANQQVVDIRSHGALCDGSADDQAAIRAALAFVASAGGGTVLIPAGVCLHSGLLDVGSNTIITGLGPASILQGTAFENNALRFLNVSNSGVSNLKFSSSSTTRLTTYESADVLFSHCSNCFANDLYVDGSPSAGIIVSASSDVRVTRNDVRNTNSDGIHVVDGSHRVVVSANTAFNTGDDSFSAVAYQNSGQTQGVTFTSNISHDSRARGISCVGAKSCVIEGNQVYNPACHGLYAAYESSFRTFIPSDIVISGNLVVNAPRADPNCQAILTSGATDITISDNHTAGGGNLMVASASNHVQVFNNYLNGSGGILIDGGSSNVFLRGNKLTLTRNGIVLNGVQYGEVSSNYLKDAMQIGSVGDAHIGIYNCRYVVGKDNLVQVNGNSMFPPGNVSSSADTYVSTLQIDANRIQGQALHPQLGGTGTFTAFAPGSVVFAGPGGSYSQDPAGLNFDSTRKVLGLGSNTSVAGYRLMMNGGAYANGGGFHIESNHAFEGSGGGASLNLYGGTGKLSAAASVVQNYNNGGGCSGCMFEIQNNGSPFWKLGPSGEALYRALPFTSLQSIPTPGAQVYCSDCRPNSPPSDLTCIAGGTGAMAFRTQLGWRCLQ